MRSDLFRIAAVAMVAALVGGGTVAWADHQFGDVPNGSFFHESVGAIVDAGCATGYPDSTFRPNTNATRGQFAYWLNNCGGRAEFATGGGSFLADEVDFKPAVATVTITAGAKGTGRGIVVVMASGTVDASAEGSVTWRLLENLGFGADLLDTAIDSVPEITGSSIQPGSTVSLMSARVVEAGETVTFDVDVNREFGIPLGNIDAELTALYFPFRGDGQAPDPPL